MNYAIAKGYCERGSELILGFLFVILFGWSCAPSLSLAPSIGFDSKDQAKEYEYFFQRNNYFLYFALQLSSEEWQLFYQRFPEYWQYRYNGMLMSDYTPRSSASAFRWTMLNRKDEWSQKTLARLNNETILPKDDIFQIIYSLGLPKRLIWNNNNFGLGVLIYQNEFVYILEKGLLTNTQVCKGCVEQWNEGEQMAKSSSVGPCVNYEELFKLTKLNVIEQLGLIGKWQDE